MGKIKSAFEKAMEKAAEIGELTPEEKENLKNQEKLKSLLAEFYKGQLDRDGLWQRLKGSTTSLLKEAQLHLIDAIGLGSLTEEFQKRKDGILAIETLKDSKNISLIEDMLKTIELLRNEYQDGKENSEKEMREAIERNPQLRLKPVRMPDGRTVLQAAVSVDEAVQARLSEFLSEHEERYGMELERIITKLKWAVSA
jgi:hypothetical protein